MFLKKIFQLVTNQTTSFSVGDDLILKESARLAWEWGGGPNFWPNDKGNEEFCTVKL